MQNKIRIILEENKKANASLLSDKNIELIEKIAQALVASIKQGGKILVFGNGGSASDSQHLAAELVGRFKKERRAFAAIALTANTSTITAISNDYGYESSFARQVEALGKKPDVAIGISTSGNAKNVIAAIQKARSLGLTTVILSGKEGGALKSGVDFALLADSKNTPRVQETHTLVIHILCELVEEALS